MTEWPGMKWLIWSPAIVIIFSAVAVPGGLVLFGLPLLALAYFVFAVIALGGSAEHRAATPARRVREQREPASDVNAEVSSDEKASPSRVGRHAFPAPLGSAATTTRRTA